MKIKRAAIVGAGAVGAYIISLLQKHMGEDFMVLAEGARAERLKTNGIEVNGEIIYPNVKAYGEAGEIDLLMFATKYTVLPEAAKAATPAVGKDTIILSLLNGIDSEQLLADIFGEEHIVPAFMRIVSHRDGSTVRFDLSKTQGVVYGEKDGSESERVKAIAELFDGAGVGYVLSHDILADQWNKYAINLADNMPQAVVGTGYHAYFDSPYMHHIQEKVMEEIRQVAAAEGITITSIPTPRDSALPKARFSTLQDIDAKRPTETDMFLGHFLALAEKHNIPVPYCDYTYNAIKVLEEKNAGKFDY